MIHGSKEHMMNKEGQGLGVLAMAKIQKSISVEKKEEPRSEPDGAKRLIGVKKTAKPEIIVGLGKL